MVTAKLAFALIQIGSNLWVNPMQLQGIQGNEGVACQTIVLISSQIGTQCSDWPIEKVREALTSALVAKALEGK